MAVISVINSLNSYNDIIVLYQRIQKKVTYVTIIRGTLLSEDYTASHLL